MNQQIIPKSLRLAERSYLVGKLERAQLVYLAEHLNHIDLLWMW